MIRSKTCFKCNLVKPLEDFYKHSQMADGHVNKCKKCNKHDVRENRSNNRDYYLAYDKQRSSNKERIAAQTEYTKQWRHKYEQKYKCHTAVGNALRSGLLTKTPCIRCGDDKHVVGHHEDYSKPLDVWWLCETCHKQRHKELLNDK